LRLTDVCLHNLPGHDIVYERHGLYQTGVAKAAKRLGMPYIVFFEADEILEHDYMGAPIKGLLRWRAKQMMHTNLKLADCILCVSDSGKSHLINAWKVPAEKILVFPNGVDVEKFNPEIGTGDNVRGDFGFQKNPLVIFVGNFFHWHDVTTLLKAFSYVLKEIPDARLLLVGDGHKRMQMEELAAELGIVDAVRFTGLIPHSEVPAYINAADVAVVPYPNTKNEMWFSPLKLYEYMACGKAVVATATGQITRVIDHDQNGILVHPEDVQSMADAILQLILDNQLRLRLGQAAREDAVKMYSWDQYVDRLERVFAALHSGQSFKHI
jgi:glycosyltransferase involved in cell wall biosynthesis